MTERNNMLNTSVPHGVADTIGLAS
jgi:hypothetical protein